MKSRIFYAYKRCILYLSRITLLSFLYCPIIYFLSNELAGHILDLQESLNTDAPPMEAGCGFLIDVNRCRIDVSGFCLVFWPSLDNVMIIHNNASYAG